MARIPVLGGVVLLLVASSAFGAAVEHGALPAGWSESAEGSGLRFRKPGKKGPSEILLGAPESSIDTPQTFAAGLGDHPPADLLGASDPETFTSPDGRALVAIEGSLDAPGKPPARRVWVFDHGQRVQAQLVTGDKAEFARQAPVFMDFVGTLRLAAQATPPVAEKHTVEPAPEKPGAASNSPTVDGTLSFTLPPGWVRQDVGNAVWLRAPLGADGTRSQILLTPAEPLSGDLGAWMARRLSPGPELKILAQGKPEPKRLGQGEALDERLTLLVRGHEQHEQQVRAERRGRVAVLVALDAPTPATLEANRRTFEAFLATLAIRAETSGAPAAAQPQPASATARAFPDLALPADWRLASEDAAWRVYEAPGSGWNHHCRILVSQVRAIADPLATLQETRRQMGMATPATPEVRTTAQGKQLRLLDSRPGRNDARTLTAQTVVLSSGGKGVVLILRGNDAALFSQAQAAFERALAGVRL